jgi:hypothetical protein
MVPTFEDVRRTMLNKAIARAMLGTLLSLSVALMHAQSRATCTYAETFPEGGLPTGWTSSPEQVERLNADGNGTGEFTPPWQVGNASQANGLGYFPVPDEPQGNTFAMANDDAPPCDCAMADVALVSPPIDLAGTPDPALSYRVYHDGRPFNGQAWLEASTDGTAWSLIEEIPAVLGTWQQRTADLSAFASGPVQLRFRYDDAGNWASGLAVDDICVFARVQNDIALTNAWLGDVTTSVFNTSTRSLGYSRLPIEQQSPLRLSARILNNGLAAATTIRAEATITWDGGTQVITTIVCEVLEPLHDTLVSWDTGFLADQAGNVAIALAVEAFNPDEETSDNAATLGFAVTSAEEGNNAMALDDDLASSECGTDDGFSAGCRFEMTGSTSTVHGISVRFGAGTLSGSRVHTLLMDASLNLLSSSASHVVNDEDLSLSFSGGSVYIPLDSVVAINGPQDLIALVRCLPDSGTLRVACGGAVAQGAAFVIDAESFLVSYPGTAPIVRIHLADPVTGLSEDQLGSPNGLALSPNPAHDQAVVGFHSSVQGPAHMEVFDAQGRRMLGRTWSGGTSPAFLDVSGWPRGMYLVQVTAPGTVQRARLIVE